jgi:hypothetical protein
MRWGHLALLNLGKDLGVVTLQEGPEWSAGKRCEWHAPRFSTPRKTIESQAIKTLEVQVSDLPVTDELYGIGSLFHFSNLHFFIVK